MLTRIQYSLSAKLIILFICAGAVLLLLVGSILGKGFSSHFRTGIQPFIVHYIELMQHEIGSPPNLQQAKRVTENIPVDVHIFGPNQSWSTAETPPNQQALENLGESSSDYQFKRIDNAMILATRDGEYDIYFQINNDSNTASGEEFSLSVLFSILGILILIYYATRAIFSPIEDIEIGVKQFGIGNLSHKISKRRNDQLGDLTDSVNKMAEDISGMLEAKRQFLLGISHELRSPLTRCRVNLALLEDSSAKTEIDREIEAMDQLINELLESERLNSPHKIIQPEPTNVDQLTIEIIENEFSDHQITVEIQPIRTNIDQARFKLLLRNLLQNAIKYSTGNTKPKVILSLEPHKMTLSVEDYGQGISQEHIPFLTEPFYRADPSRRRMTGGYGLGLYLCRMIVEAHSGQLSIDSKLGKGTCITCTFPVA